MLLDIIVISTIWLVFSSILFGGFAKIEPEDRNITKRLWFRSLMVIAGPLTIVVVAIIFVGTLALEFLVESVRDDIPQAFANFFAKEA